MIKFIGILPYFISYVDNLKDGFAGITNGPFIKIKKAYRHDLGLHAHEITHVKQWYRTFGLHSFLYKVSDTYRLKAEIEAYRSQLDYCIGNYDWVYLRLLNNYDLDVSMEELKELI